MTGQAVVYSDLHRLNDWRFHVKHLKLGHQQSVTSRSGGASRSLRKGRGMDFSEVRQYQAGDEVRHIDWRVTARTQKPHTKLFSEEHERPILFIVEQSAALFFGSQKKFKSVLALDILSTLGWAALNQGDRVGGTIVGSNQWIAPKRQDKHLQQLFQLGLNQQQTLTTAGNANHQAWSIQLQRLIPMVHPNSKIIFIGELEPLKHCVSQLQTLSKHSDILAIQLVDPLEYQLPNNGVLSLTNGEHNVKIDTDDLQIQQKYAEQFHQAWLSLQQSLNQAKVQTVKVETTDNLIDQLMQLRLLRR